MGYGSRKLLPIILLLLIGALSAYAQQYGYTDDGDRIVLYEDGTWEIADISVDAPMNRPLLVTELRWRQQEEVLTLYVEVVNVSGRELEYINFYVAAFDSDGFPIALEDPTLDRYSSRFFAPGDAFEMSESIDVPANVVIDEVRVISK